MHAAHHPDRRTSACLFCEPESILGPAIREMFEARAVIVRRGIGPQSFQRHRVIELMSPYATNVQMTAERRIWPFFQVFRPAVRHLMVCMRGAVTETFRRASVGPLFVPRSSDE